MSSDAKRQQRSAGSRTVFDVIRGGFRMPKTHATENEIPDVRDGSSRVVSCSLRGPRDPFPKRTKQGSLQISNRKVIWFPTWGLHRRRIEIDEQFRSISVRDPGKAEWNVKKGGNAFGVIPIPKFQVIECESDKGTFEFTVPQLDLDLVESALRNE
jgi:hypothetical protein